MKRLKRFSSTWKLPAIFLVAAILGVVSLPSQYQPSFLPDSLKEMNINLGLDLQGGSQLDYKIDLSRVAEEDTDQIVQGILSVINDRVNRLGVSEPNIYLSSVGDEQHIIVELAGVSDLEEAKAQVGKTIQLEFKEENDATENSQLEVVLENTNRFAESLQEEGANFSTLADLRSKSAPNQVFYNKVDAPSFSDQIPGEKLFEELEKLEVGQFTTNYFEDSLGYMIIDNRVVETRGYVFAKLNSKEIVERENSTLKEVTVSDILISYDGAKDSASELSQVEAKALAENLLAQIKNEEISFDEAKTQNDSRLENSDGLFGSDTVEYEEVKLSFENVGELSQTVLETEYGFYILRADAVKPSEVTVSDEVQYTYETVTFSTLPDPWKATELNGSFFERATVVSQNGFTPVVSIEFTAEGARLFEELTERNIGKRLAIFVGGNLISSPTVNAKISGGNAVIQGSFSFDEAQELARDLNTGAIPAPISLSGQYTIGPNLGQEALTSSLNAGVIGLVLLALYMVFYYRFAGVLANIALVVYSIVLVFLIKSSLPVWISLLAGFTIYMYVLVQIYKNNENLVEKILSFTVATFALFFISFLLSSSVVLTLAGIAGIILSIGMAVDANVLIFERIKEEIRDGKSYVKAVEDGFDRAWSSIRDSNFSSLITCGILYFFGSSIIRGFALNLAIGILVSMFSAIILTKGMMRVMNKFKFKESKWMIGASKGDKKVSTFDIIGKSKISLAVSGLLIVTSIVSISVNGLNAGIDFTGGTLMEVTFDEAQDESTKAKLESIIANATGSDDINVVEAGDTAFIVKTVYFEEQTHDVILQNIRNEITTSFEETRFTTVGPTISESLKSKAFVALSLALIAIIVYIALTFRNIPKKYSPWKFGFSAIIALMHDVIITLGIFSLFGLQIDALFITALLTVIGFSVHDTIVVFDRIRENLKGLSLKAKNFAEVCNVSLSQTLARSLNTSISTLFTLLSLLFFGSSSIFEFVLALVIGIVVGTYSSIFVASTSLNWLIKKK